MSKLFFPPDVLGKMVCLHCKNYLSYFPINIKKDTTGAMCGRCTITNIDDFIRDEAYERLAQFLLFPCIYKDNGCKEQLTPAQLEKHEKCCESRKFPCPNKNDLKCLWTGPRIDMIAHFQENHPDLLMKDGTFELDFTKFSKENFILSHNDEIFLVRREVDSRKEIFLCSVEHFKANEDVENYDYFVKAETGDKNYFHKYSERSTDGQDTSKLNLATLKEQLHNPATILATIKIMQSKRDTHVEEVVRGEGNAIKNNPDINWDMLAELECPVCFEYMLPPIYQCLNGHSICKECKPKVQVCPLCQGIIQDTKNFALEKMTKFLIYPCKFYRSGCNHSCKANDIKKHEDSCEFGPYVCPLAEHVNCNWKSNINELTEHVENNHNDNILKTDKVDIAYNKELINRSDRSEYLIKFSKRIFKLYYKYENEKIFWTIQLIGPVEESKKYNYEIDLVDYSGNKRRCYLTAPVSQLTKPADCFNNATHALTLTSEFVDPFIKNNILGFCVLVSTK